MGTVYLAEQEEPVRRRVAIELIKPGMDTREAGPGAGDPEHRINRGGHCTYVARRARSWMRAEDAPDTREFWLGVRPSCALR